MRNFWLKAELMQNSIKGGRVYKNEYTGDKVRRKQGVQKTKHAENKVYKKYCIQNVEYTERAKQKRGEYGITF